LGANQQSKVKNVEEWVHNHPEYKKIKQGVIKSKKKALEREDSKKIKKLKREKDFLIKVITAELSNDVKGFPLPPKGLRSITDPAQWAKSHPKYLEVKAKLLDRIKVKELDFLHKVVCAEIDGVISPDSPSELRYIVDPLGFSHGHPNYESVKIKVLKIREKKLEKERCLEQEFLRTIVMREIRGQMMPCEIPLHLRTIINSQGVLPWAREHKKYEELVEEETIWLNDCIEKNKKNVDVPVRGQKKQQVEVEYRKSRSKNT